MSLPYTDPLSIRNTRSPGGCASREKTVSRDFSLFKVVLKSSNNSLF